jgi:hypothetical protein
VTENETSINRVYLSWQDVQDACSEIMRQMDDDAWRPTLIMGLTRGGLAPGAMISHALKVPMTSLDVSLRDDDLIGPTSTWVPELITQDHRILVVDDINDTGATFNWIRQDWRWAVRMYHGGKPDQPWPQDAIRFASLVHNLPSLAPIDFHGQVINKAVHPSWICFPWETWYQL